MPDYGLDLKTVVDANGNVDLTDTMLESTGRAVLIEALVRRQTTPRGSVIDAPNSCFDVRDWLNDGMTGTQIQALQGLIVNELKKDQRVLQVSALVTFNAATRTLTVVETVLSSDGPFSLTLNVSDVTVELLTSGL